MDKDSASRVQNKKNLFFFYAEAQPILWNDSASRVQNKKNLFFFLCRGAAYLMKR